VREQIPRISTFGRKRRSTRITHTVPLLISWVDSHKKGFAEEAATESINCHGFQYFSRQRPQSNTPLTLQITEASTDGAEGPEAYSGRVAWIRRSLRLEGLNLVAVELGIPFNIWGVEEAPKDWAAFTPAAKEDPATFLAEVDRMLQSSGTATYYHLLGVETSASRSEVKRHFYQLARRYHPDHHMDHPEWTPRLLSLMAGLTAAYRILSDDKTKKDYDAHLRDSVDGKAVNFRNLAQGYIDKAHECMAEKNFSGSILWLHRAIESEPGSAGYRVTLGRCLSAIPEYRREAVEQFEKAIELDPRNLAAHFFYGELLEELNVPWRARFHYLRVLEIDANYWEARKRLNQMGAGMPRASLKPSLLGRLTGRR
jgi:curved DNA-binding protein CbpA